MRSGEKGLNLFLFLGVFLFSLIHSPISSFAFSCGALFLPEYHQVPFAELQPGMYFVRGHEGGIGIDSGVVYGRVLPEGIRKRSGHFEFELSVRVNETFPSFLGKGKEGEGLDVLPVDVFLEGPPITVFSSFESMMRHFLRTIGEGDRLVFKTKKSDPADPLGSWVAGKYRSSGFEAVEVVDLTGTTRKIGLSEIQPDSLGYQFRGTIKSWWFLDFLEREFEGRTIRLKPRESARESDREERLLGEIEGVLLRKDPEYEGLLYKKDLEVSIFILTETGIRVVLLEDFDRYAIEFLPDSDSGSFRGSVEGERVRWTLKSRSDRLEGRLANPIEGVQIERDRDGISDVSAGRHQDSIFILTDGGIHMVLKEDIGRYRRSQPL